MIISRTGQDVSLCSSCALCEDVAAEAGDVSLSMLMQWILANDARALTNATVWSDDVLRQADCACANQLNLPAVLLALRDEARRRGLAQNLTGASRDLRGLKINLVQGE